jgi:hypothetical protein
MCTIDKLTPTCIGEQKKLVRGVALDTSKTQSKM